MNETTSISALRAKVAQIIGDNRRLRSELSKALNEKAVLSKQKISQQQKIAELEKRVEVLELAKGFAGGSSNNGSESGDKARRHVNKLLREVDKCIALMNK